MIDISVIILTFNSAGFIEPCLDSLSKSKGVFFGREEGKGGGYSGEIIVVDNASRDNTVTVVKKKFPSVSVIETGANIGFSAGNNRGIAKSSGRYVLLLNPDTFVQKNTLSAMLKFMDENEDVGISTCYLELVKTGKMDPASHRGFPTPFASFTYYLGLEKIFPKRPIFSKYHQLYKDLSEIHEIDSPSGAFFLVRRNVFEKIGLLDEDYFMYAEDIDFAYRAKGAGFKVVYYPHAKAFHYKGMSSGIKKDTVKRVSATKAEKEASLNAFYDTMKTFYRKHFESKYPFFIKWAVFAGIEIKRLISRVKRAV